jgi:hypothetical protein
LFNNIFEGVTVQLYSNQQTAGMLMIVKKLAITAAIASLMASHAIYAEEHHEAERDHHAAERGHEAVRDHHVFAVSDVHRFNRAELKLWRGGRWNKTCFMGRCGWWWFAEGQWYFYDRPVYPYPLVVSEINYLEPLAVAPVVVAPQAPVMVAPQAPVVVAPQTPAPAPVQAPVQTWYYCESAKNYYPYVPSCPEGWRPVPAQPPSAPR